MKKTPEEVEKIIQEKYLRYDEDTKERIRQLLLEREKETTYNTTQEQNELIAKAIDHCPCCKSRSRFAQEHLNISSLMLYKKLKGIRRFTTREIAIIEKHFNIKLNGDE